MIALTRSFAALGALLVSGLASSTLAAPIGDKRDALLADLGGERFYRAAGQVRQDDSCRSCSSCASGADSCSVNTPGGLLLLTTFWDTDPSTGPSDVFTIHGLWPDNCDGSYSSGCDSSRDYRGIQNILESAGKTDLLNYMQTNWVSNDDSNEKFWEHEWSKHGTCVSTLAPSCYGDNYQQYEDMIDFFQTAVDLHQQYNIYQALANAGYSPGNSYQLSDLEDATSNAFGQSALFQCERGAISGAELAFYTQGRSTSANGFDLIAPIQSSRCPDNVQWNPK